MHITSISAFTDNYIWLFTDNQLAFVVDPGDAKPVIDYMTQHNLKMGGVLLTHHHPDHSGGIAELLKQYGSFPVAGSKNSKIPAVNHHVQENDEVQCGQHTFRVMEIPGHTLDHIAFYNDEILFCGDTLFSAGCGRVFEGTYQQMHHSLGKLAELPSNLRVYCGHEYTLQNLLFAEKVEPENKDIQKKIIQVKKQLLNQKITLPGLLEEEKSINPFLRCHVSGVIQAGERYAGTKLENPDAVFKVIREWKNAGG